MITLVRERALSHFANLLSVYCRSLRRVWIVSPWVTETESFYALNVALHAIQRARATLTVVTRTPTTSNHQAAVRTLQLVPQAEIFLLEHLHAKLYMLESDGVRAALLGSANFTEEGNSDLIEIVADIRSSRESDPAAGFITELNDFARDLTCLEAANCVKSIAPGWWRSGSPHNST